VFETVPGDAFGLAIGGADIPDDSAGDLGEVKHLGECEMSLAEAAAGDEDAEAGGGIIHVELARVEAEDVFAGVTGRHTGPRIKPGKKEKAEWPRMVSGLPVGACSASMNTDEHG
jgi:hypothetical protein